MLASEYGWGMDRCLDVPLDVLAALRHALLTRKGVPCTFSQRRATSDDKPLADKVRDILGGIDKSDKV